MSRATLRARCGHALDPIDPKTPRDGVHHHWVAVPPAGPPDAARSSHPAAAHMNQSASGKGLSAGVP